MGDDVGSQWLTQESQSIEEIVSSFILGRMSFPLTIFSVVELGKTAQLIL